MANFKPLNRYTNGIITFTREEQQFLVLRQPLSLKEDSGDTFITITQDLTKRPDMISQLAYNTPALWWVLMEYNNISDPLFGLKTNQILRVPKINRVLEAISTMNRV